MKLIEDGLKTVFENSKPSPDDLHWRPGQICIARWVDDKWYRARVIEVDNLFSEIALPGPFQRNILAGCLRGLSFLQKVSIFAYYTRI